MQIKLVALLGEQLKDKLAPFDVEVETDYNGKARDTSINLLELTESEVKKLRNTLHDSNLRGTKVLVADLDKYMKAAKEGPADIQARTVRQATWLMEPYIASLEHHVVFSEDEYGGNSHSGYLVTDVRYRPEVRERGSYTPEALVIELCCIQHDSRSGSTLELEKEDVLLLTPQEILAKRGYVPESPELIAKLEKETVRYFELREKVGLSCHAVGLGFNDLDTAGATSRSRRGAIRMDNFGAESKVVIDVLFEEDSEKRRSKSDGGVDPYRWHKWNMRFYAPDEDALARHLRANEKTDVLPDVLIPVHPLVPIFDLKRHQRLTVHVNNLTEYVYNKGVAKNLVLPERDWKMVELLVDHSRNFFQDIVGGKGASMNILSEGPPGTGKTATAEVFAEFKERPLYTVQCSQLGIEPADVEKNLSTILWRANRWNAILLLDEADVYIRKRGEDINQNAIVGAFLRVLEYASCILFMTTNLPEDVDDAVASRCIARLSYGPPGEVAQARIWRNLADLNNLEMSEADIKLVTKKHPTLSGRDVKNLLKLASFVAQSKDAKAITAADIEFALQFKPTQTAKVTT